MIAKLDRLSRDAHFLLGLEKAGVDFVAADMPQAKAALGAAKRRGKKLGGYRGAKITPSIRKAAKVAVKARTDARAADLAPVIVELRSAGVTSLGGLARALTERGIPTSRGGSEWSAIQVSRVLSRLDQSP